MLDLKHVPVIRAECEPVLFDNVIHAALTELNLDPSVMVFDKDIRVSGQIHYSSDSMHISMSIKGAQNLVCSRCLRAFKQDFHKDIQLDFEPRGRKTINILPELTEELRSEAPISVLCKDDCKGLCAGCGQNLNTDKCRCLS